MISQYKKRVTITMFKKEYDFWKKFCTEAGITLSDFIYSALVHERNNNLIPLNKKETKK